MIDNPKEILHKLCRKHGPTIDIRRISSLAVNTIFFFLFNFSKRTWKIYDTIKCPVLYLTIVVIVKVAKYPRRTYF